MPTYDLKCSDCGKQFTIMVSIKEKETLHCPKCGSGALKQEFKSVNVGAKSRSKGSSCKSSSFG